MTPRDTTTGSVLEAMVLPALQRSGYHYQPQAKVGVRFGSKKRKHKVDVLAGKPAGKKFIVSVKWQQGSGTAEQKVPYEVMCLAEAITDSKGTIHKAYLVLGGAGWSLRDFYIGGGLAKYLRHTDTVEILSLEKFVARANKQKL
jgi:PD-(D/E)XK nuclease superfamily protein